MYNSHTYHQSIVAKFLKGGIPCTLTLKKRGVGNPKFIATTCLFKMDRPYKKFATYKYRLLTNCKINAREPIIIRIYYDASTEYDVREFGSFKNVELVKYEFPQFIINKMYHQGTFGTFTRLFALFDYDDNNTPTFSFDADMLFKYNDVLNCISIMTKTDSGFYGLLYDCTNINNIDKRITDKSIDDMVMMTYIIDPRKVKLPSSILIDFFKRVNSRDVKLVTWLNSQVTENIKPQNNAPLFAYGLDEYFLNSFIVPEIMQVTSIIGTRLYMVVRRLHYELYNQVHSGEIPANSSIFDDIYGIFRNVFKRPNTLIELVDILDDALNNKMSVLNEFNYMLLLYKKYLDLHIRFNDSGVVKYTDEHKVCLNKNKNSSFVHDVFVFHQMKTHGAGCPVIAIVPASYKGVRLPMETLVVDVPNASVGNIYNAAAKSLEGKDVRIVLFEKNASLSDIKQIVNSHHAPFIARGILLIELQDFIKINGAPDVDRPIGCILERLKANNIQYLCQNTCRDIQESVCNDDSSGFSDISIRVLKTLNKKNRTTMVATINESLRHIVIVVPFAEFNPEEHRSSQLQQYVHHMTGLINETSHIASVSIVIAEQSTPKLYFNRGQLLNAGIKWFTDRQQPDVIVFHDVDMLPDKTLFAEYMKINTPLSLVPYDDEYKRLYGYGPLGAGGGIFGIPYNDFKKINGYPNTFWGWGGEDNAFDRRMKTNGLQYKRVTVGAIHHIDVHRAKSPTTKMDFLRKNKVRSMMVHENLASDSKLWKNNGYANVKAQVIEESTSGPIHHVKFALNEDKLKQTIEHNKNVYNMIKK